MKQRISQVKDAFISLNLDALFITNQYNVSYLTGFAGLSPNEREGFLFLTAKSAHLITFSTYYQMYKAGGDGFITHCITMEKRLHNILSSIIDVNNIKKIGFEPDSITVTELETLQKKLKMHFVQTENTVENFRKIKDRQELAAISRAARVTDEAYEHIKGKIKKGVSEKDLALEIEFFIKKNADDVAFSPIVAFDKNSAIPHYIPNNIKPALPAGRHITYNNLILLDFGAKLDGYCSDMTRVIFFGAPTNHRVDIYNTVLSAQEKALSVLKPEIKAQDADHVAREYITQKGYPAYQHGLGHGVGLAIHESPKLRTGITDVLKENMVVTVEPGIYLPGDCGVRIEDLVVLKPDGIEVLSKSTKEITIL